MSYSQSLVQSRRCLVIFIYSIITFLIVLIGTIPASSEAKEVTSEQGVHSPISSHMQNLFASCYGSSCDGKYPQEQQCQGQILPGRDFTYIHRTSRGPVRIGNWTLLPYQEIHIASISLWYSKLCQALYTSVTNLSNHPLEVGVCTFRRTLFRETNENTAEFICWSETSPVVLTTHLNEAPFGRIEPNETIFSPLVGISMQNEQFFWGGANVYSNLDETGGISGGPAGVVYANKGVIELGKIGDFS